MTDLLSDDQVDSIREAMNDLADTFAFPITLIRTTYTDGAFQAAPVTEEIPLTAIRDRLASASDDDQYRNEMGPTAAHERDLYIGWQKLEDAGLIDAENNATIDHNDLVRMEGEIYEILAFGGIADMTKKPAFLQLRVQRRFQNPNLAAAV